MSLPAPPTTQSGPRDTTGRELSRRQAMLEVLALIGGVLAIMWLAPLTPWRRPLASGITVALIGLLIACHLRDRPGLRALGIRWDNFWLVLRRLAVPVAGFVIVSVAIGWVCGSLRFGPRFFAMLLAVPLWGLLQQYLLLGFVHRRMRLVIGFGWPAILATTAIFALVHLPNPVLVVACGLGGFIWAREYDRSPNLLAHAVSHAVGSAFLANSVPDAALKHMVVGYRYLLL